MIKTFATGFVAFLISGFVTAQTSAPMRDVGVNNISVDCPSLFALAYGKFDNDEVVLGIKRDDWNKTTDVIVNNAASACINRSTEELVERGKWTLEKGQFLQKVRNNISAKVYEIVKANDAKRADEQKRIAEQKKNELQAVAFAKAEKAKQLAQCEEKPAYQMYNAASDLIVSQANLKYIQEQVARERKISQASGVRNLANDYANGMAIIDLQAGIKTSWATYKKLGGKAASQQKVSQVSEDPCASFRNIADQ